MKKKIIIHTGNLSVGGQEKMMIEFLNVLTPEKYDVLLLIEEDKGKKNEYEKFIPEWVKYKFLTSNNFIEKLEKYKSKKKGNIFYKILYSIMLSLKKKIAINNFKKNINFADIIIDYNMGLLRYLHKLNLKNKKVVAWCHLGDGQLGRNKQKNKNMLLYSKIVCINEIMKNGFEKNYKSPTLKFETIYNFMDEERILKMKEEKLEEDYGNFISTVGALTEIKNHQLLIKSFKILVDGGRKENLIIIGEGVKRQELEKLIADLKLENKVFLLGKKANPYKYIKKSELYVQSSWLEGMPLVVIEAMIIGKAVVCTDNSGSREIIQDNEFGLLVESDEKKLADTILKVLENKELKERLEKKSLERSIAFYRNNGKKNIENLLDNIK